MHGGKGPKQSMASKKHSQIDLTYDVHFNTGIFEQLQVDNYVNNLIKLSIEVDLVSDHEGWLVKNVIDHNIKSLKS